MERTKIFPCDFGKCMVFNDVLETKPLFSLAFIESIELKLKEIIEASNFNSN